MLVDFVVRKSFREEHLGQLRPGLKGGGLGGSGKVVVVGAVVWREGRVVVVGEEGEEEREGEYGEMGVLGTVDLGRSGSGFLVLDVGEEEEEEEEDMVVFSWACTLPLLAAKTKGCVVVSSFFSYKRAGRGVSNRLFGSCPLVGLVYEPSCTSSVEYLPPLSRRLRIGLMGRAAMSFFSSCSLVFEEEGLISSGSRAEETTVCTLDEEFTE